MSKLSKKKTEIKIENIFKEKFTAIYVGFMMVVFSIFYQNAFFNIAQAKIKPILKMSGSYCPYCGVMDYGIE